MVERCERGGEAGVVIEDCACAIYIERRSELLRDPRKIDQLLEQLIAVAGNERENIMPVTIELVKNGASMGDIIERLKTIWGTYRETPVF